MQTLSIGEPSKNRLDDIGFDHTDLLFVGVDFELCESSNLNHTIDIAYKYNPVKRPRTFCLIFNESGIRDIRYLIEKADDVNQILSEYNRLLDNEINLNKQIDKNPTIAAAWKKFQTLLKMNN